MEDVVKPMNSMCHLLYHVFLIKKYFVWNTMAVDKAFCNSIYGNLSRRIMSGDGKYISGIYVYSCGYLQLGVK